MQRYRIMVVDDHEIVRDGLAAILEAVADMELVASEATGASAVGAYALSRPDVVILDLRLPDGHGATVIEALVAHDARARILVLSGHEGEDDVFRAINAGARGYLPKDISREHLLDAIRKVGRGLRVFGRDLLHKADRQRSREGLTSRELEVLARAREGMTNREIGRALGITEGTVKVHLNHVFQKLGAKTRTEAVTVALRLGVLDEDH